VNGLLKHQARQMRGEPREPAGLFRIEGCEPARAEISRQVTCGGIIFIFNMLGLLETGCFITQH